MEKLLFIQNTNFFSNIQLTVNIMFNTFFFILNKLTQSAVYLICDFWRFQCCIKWITGENNCEKYFGLTIVTLCFFYFSFPEHALSILRSGKFRQMLLQSLFIDKVYWDGLGGRKAIEDILEVMDRRGKMLLKYVNDKKARKRS